ncbi:MAG: PDZ domain-containing protein, partial [Chloroflexota bacterium]
FEGGFERSEESTGLIVPIFEFDVPSPPLIVGEWYDVIASGDVIAPDGSVQTLRREFQVYVGSPADRAARMRLSRWESLNETVTDIGFTGLWVLFSVHAAVAYWGVRARGTFPPLDVTTAFVRRAMSGIRVAEYEPAGPDMPPYGVAVNQVSPGSVWEHAGVEPGDILVALGDEKVHTPDVLGKRLGTMHRDGVYRLIIWRAGHPLGLTLLVKHKAKRTV